MEKGNKRLAVLVGCNYPNTKYELHGCINDVLTMRDALVNRFGFDTVNVELLTDASGSEMIPTGSNIRLALNRMVDRAEAGDVLFFHYSGHGTRIPSPKSGFPSRHDEAIVPSDFNLITDVDFRHLVNRVPRGASFTILSDSCHSGGLIDKEKEQIGPSTVHDNRRAQLSDTTAGGHDAATGNGRKLKFIPFHSLLDHLSSLTQINTSDLATHLLHSFGTDVSLKFRAPQEAADMAIPRLKSDEGILLSGCQANETSADLSAAGNSDGKACGAFSNSVQIVLRENPRKRLSNRELVTAAREVLKGQRMEQHPCLYCSDENADAPFLGEHEDHH